MAVVSGTVSQVHTIKSDALSNLQIAEVLFTVSGTYAVENGQLDDVDGAIQSSRRNGKTVTILAAMPSTPATKASDPSAILGLKTVAVSSDDVTFEITDGDHSTELANGAVPSQDRPFAILVAFTEA